MRQLPPPPPPPSIDDRQGAAVIVQIRHYDLLTPLFGGSARPGEVDEKHPIRGSSIRGQLRFWWRATRGGNYANRDDMKAAEDAIWGSTKTGSRVTVNVTQANAGQLFPASDEHGNTTDNNGNPLTIGHQNSRDSYAAFPLRGDQNRPAGEVRSGVTFQLRLSFDPTVAEEVRAALWAWDTFGGIGARTRRGFGALRCRQVDAVAGATVGPWQWLYEGQSAADSLTGEDGDVTRYVSAGAFPAGVPHLSRTATRYRVITHHDSDAVAAWRGLIASLRKFRQSRPPTHPRPGRSHWPEPDAIRRLTRQPWPLPATRTAYYAFDKFPRAAFGLPIIFEFRGEPGGLPRKTTLQGAHHSRLASPLILRPLALAGGGFARLAVVLEGPRVPPGGLVLDGPTGSPSVDSDLDPATGETTAVSHRHPTYNGNPDILQAFLDQL